MSALLLNFKCLGANHSPSVSSTNYTQVLLILVRETPLAGDLHSRAAEKRVISGVGTTVETEDWGICSGELGGDSSRVGGIYHPALHLQPHPWTSVSWIFTAEPRDLSSGPNSSESKLSGPCLQPTATFPTCGGPTLSSLLCYPPLPTLFSSGVYLLPRRKNNGLE